MTVKPLDGLVVVALEQAVAGPYCSSRLADAGARVIKIERPEGDFARFYDEAVQGQCSYFVWLNRGKESVVLDLQRAQDKATLEALIASADILIQNLKPGALERLGLGIQRLRKDYPALICCSISGYGHAGPLAGRKAYDLLVQAESGLASVTGGADGPARVGISVTDIATGAAAHAAILEALIARSRNGQGTDIEISMFDVMADWLTVPLLQTEGGQPPPRMGLAHPSIAPYGVFKSREGHALLISIQSEREWKVFCREVLSAPRLTSDERFATNVLRVQNRAALDAAVSEIFAAGDFADLTLRLAKADIAFATLNDMAGLSVHPHLRRVTVATPNGPVRYPAPAVVFDGQERSLGAVPVLGADTERVRGAIAKIK